LALIEVAFLLAFGRRLCSVSESQDRAVEQPIRKGEIERRHADLLIK